MSDATARLGGLLSGGEAGRLAARLADGDTLAQALQSLAQSRRSEIRAALEDAGLSASNLSVTLPVLRAIQGAAEANTTEVSPIWTLPGNLADYGSLTTSIRALVLSARTSVTCSTFNFQKSSTLWNALREVAEHGTVDVRVYLDTQAADQNEWSGATTSGEVAAQLTAATVFRTRSTDGKTFRNHAKFIAVDHRFLVVTSANFSVSAEHHNVELGLRIDSRSLTETVEKQLQDVASTLYERVEGS
ncbi:PLD-like domain-containing protein [Tessaracoccus bendigoensis DSM 12906]|uniref:PLD-like domain-containing protein n=1 Tax=Tessaracoccus bendigoensis DSM 12906 TaxID=1123357 RepID=A0A1M6FNX6_9ACTN|nr:DISARM system phospholipase D-like protein DrmC [Tessaracoccus bendigoensis]SHI99365.1 PLD-like domain-containing protein [Tessaracoccus bendigoensis DSM 12906]